MKIAGGSSRLAMVLEKGTCRELLKVQVQIGWCGLHELVNPCVASGSRFAGLKLGLACRSWVVSSFELT